MLPKALILVTGLAVASAALAQASLAPADEAASRMDFFSFRAQLQAAIARRDAAAVLAVVHEDIRVSFGPDNGIEAFKRMWRPEAPDSELWEALGTVLPLGGSFDREGRFVAPYVFSRWPENLDAFEYVAIVGEDVRVRAEPSTDAPTLGALSFAVVPLAVNPEATPGWTAIRLPGTGPGYVASRYARSPVDYRAIFERTGGQWRLVAFVAGD